MFDALNKQNIIKIFIKETVNFYSVVVHENKISTPVDVKVIIIVNVFHRLNVWILDIMCQPKIIFCLRFSFIVPRNVMIVTIKTFSEWFWVYYENITIVL